MEWMERRRKAVVFVFKGEEKVQVISLLFIGKPEPMVAWHVNGDLEDATYHSDRYGNVINELVFRGLNRSHLNSQFSCKAFNTRLTQPVEKSVVLDLNRKLNFNS